METSEDTPNWIPTFSGTSDAGDSASSFQSAQVDPQSDEQSFDAISRQKLNLVEQTAPPKNTAPAPPISMFEEDTRSSWSVEPPKQPVPNDEECLGSPESAPIQPFKEALEEGFPEKTLKDESLDSVFLKPQEEESQSSLKSTPPKNTSPTSKDALDEDSQNSLSLKPPAEELQSNGFLLPLDEQSQPNDVFLNPQEEQSEPNSVFLNPPEEQSQLNHVFPNSHENQSEPNLYLNTREEQSQPNNIFLDPPEEQSQPNDVFLKPSKEQITSPKIDTPKETTMEEESEKKPDEEEPRSFPPENLFEYMWPQDQEGAEFFILQEQICEYLGLKSFRRKNLSTMARRPVELEEREFLREKGVVTEVQCDLGLTALRSEEVLELMSKEFPEHYAEYIKVLREREQQSISEKHREYAATNADKTKMVDLVRRAVQSAAEYNAHLNQERREERRSCMDLQTFTIHYPKSNKPKITPEVSTKPGKYPVALLPGQFQDYYKEYSSDELKYLPVNTVLYGPLKELQGGEDVSSDSEDSSASDGSCCSSSHEDSSSESEEKGEESEYKPKVKPNATCKVCKKASDPTSKDELVHCADCDNSAHPACIELSAEVVEVLRTYPWQCTDCKVCSQCRDPNDEDKMLFCDTCDRGYHTFCVGLKQLPAGKWVCRKCGTCSVCGATRPGEKAQWHCEAGEGGRPRILCQACNKKKR